MRKLTSCRIVLALCLATVTVSSFAGSEILSNSGFEDGDLGQFGTVTIPGWDVFGTNGYHHDESGNVIGSKAIKSSTFDTVVRQDFPITAGEQYIFSVKMFSSSSDPLTQAEGVMFAKWYDGEPGVAGTAKISEYQVGSFDPGSDSLDSWKIVAGRLIAPAGAAYARIALKLSSDAFSGYIYFDEASVRQVNMAADLNNDDVVDLADYAMLASAWDQSSSLYSLDGDSDVDIDDLVEFIDNWLIEDPGVLGYTLVWSDEFNGSSIDTTKWNFEIGNGEWGWGNNELQYYTGRTENARTENGNLVIEARAESYGGFNYTSARMTTQSKAYWTYGKMEARIKLPYGQGMWPAFWMMPQEYWNPGWPECGEIDIMEAVNTVAWVKSSLHYGQANPQNHQSYGSANYYLPGGGNFSQDFHVYGMEWEEGLFKFFVDGVQIGSTTSWWATYEAWPAPFNRPFFFILNVAVGGQWPGSPNGSTVFPQQMLVDWVRVYQKPEAPAEPIAVPGRIEAEDYDTGGEGVAYHDTGATNEGGAYRGDGVDIESCDEGGYNVGWIDAGEWLTYTIDVTAGTYDIDVRVASPNSGKSFHIEIDDVDVTGTMNVPKTGNTNEWQNWQTVTKSSVTLTGGEHVLKFVANTDGFNLNYIDIQ
ncbi:MAG: carbohydrate-binding protein [Planctomycetota bacterium]|jgi:beta-glucanase (GH16 family)